MPGVRFETSSRSEPFNLRATSCGSRQYSAFRSLVVFVFVFDIDWAVDLNAALRLEALDSKLR
jgi:hypothetical protein